MELVYVSVYLRGRVYTQGGLVAWSQLGKQPTQL